MATEHPQRRSGPRQHSVFLIWITANLRSWTAFVLPSRSVAIDTPLMNLFSGTAPSHDCPSTRLSLPVIASSSKTGQKPNHLPEHFRCVGRAGRIDLQPL